MAKGDGPREGKGEKGGRIKLRLSSDILSGWRIRGRKVDGPPVLGGVDGMRFLRTVLLFGVERCFPMIFGAKKGLSFLSLFNYILVLNAKRLEREGRGAAERAVVVESSRVILVVDESRYPPAGWYPKTVSGTAGGACFAPPPSLLLHLNTRQIHRYYHTFDSTAGQRHCLYCNVDVASVIKAHYTSMRRS
jgi:hypothetical protein